jgi:molybdenum cofactor cytidylyltransferase
MTAQPDIHVIILAAGASRRLGEPKQQIEFQGKRLWQVTVDMATELGHPITLVSGAWRPSGPYPATMSELHFAQWREGQSSTIAYATQSISTPRKGYLLLAVDHWGLTSQSLNSFIKVWNEEDIQWAADNAYTGLPALIPTKYRNKLLKLQGDKGIQPLATGERIRRIQLPRASWVANTPEDQFLIVQLSDGDSLLETV